MPKATDDTENTDDARRAGGAGKGAKRSTTTRLEDARARMYQDLIFESAEYLFGAKGFENATMQEIAREAGVSLKTVYAQFPGKQDLYDAIMATRGREMFEAVRAAHERAATPVDQLIEGTRAFSNYLFDHQDWSHIHVRSQISWATRPAGEVTGELWDKGQRAHEAMLEEGIAAGLFHDEDPAEIALMIRALTRVHVVNAIERGETDRDGIADRLIARLLRMICVDGADAPVRELGVG